MLDAPAAPPDEQERLKALRRYRILDSEPEPQYDRIVDIAKRRFGVAYAFVSFVDSDRVFFKARGQLSLTEYPRNLSFCAHALLEDKVLVVPDATKDSRFADSPLVVGDLQIRFYAGAPLIASSGHRLGTVCLLDTRPWEEFSDSDQQDLSDLAAIISDYLEMRLIVGDVHHEIEIRRAAEAKAHELAYHDVLTGLPNRAHLQKVVADGLPFVPRRFLAAVAADLDELKTVNDTFGHFAGDELICRTASMIKAAFGERAFVARISGDEFVALIDGDSREAIQTIANDLVEATAAPVSLAGRMISNGVSLGVAFADPGDADIDALVRNADLALCAAKKGGRRRAAVFDEKMATETRRLANLKHALVGAIKERSIEVAYQPIYAAPNGPMIGVEALARWNDPKTGPVDPADLIGLAEESGQIVELGDHILKTALEAASGWRDISLSVSLSPVQLRLSSLARTVAVILGDAGFPANRLEFEVIEGGLVEDFAAAKRQIEALSDIGVSVALDDFGKGYSCLNYLAALPFNKVKIDRSLVDGMRGEKKREAIVRHIVDLARGLDMRVAAEGVETEEDARLLAAVGCTSLQGRYFGDAMPAVDIGRRLGEDMPRG